MKKKLLAGILALALCSTNMPQAIFAGEFTSGNPDVVSEEETPGIFTNEEQETAGETEEELSVFSSEEFPEFNDTPDEAMAAAENTQIKEIDLINSTEVANEVYTISSAGDYKFTCSNRQETANRIVVDGKNTSEQDNINIYLDNVNIKTSAGPALQIQRSVKTQVYIYLEGINKLNNSGLHAALQKDNAAKLTIDNSSKTIGELIAIGSYGAGIGGGYDSISSNITISGGSVTATSTYGAGIGGGFMSTGSNITISGGSVTATSGSGAGIGGGPGYAGSDITISGGSVTATSDSGAGIGGGYDSISSNITISGGSVTATSTYGAGIGGGQGNTGSKITISGGSVNAQIDCTPHKNLNSSGKYDPNSPNVYLCTIPNAQNERILIDADATPWIPSSHIAVDPDEKKLYAWLTGETHTISVGNTTQTYYFDKTNQKFQPITNQNFTFTEPSNLTYNGKPKTASLQCNIQHMGNITWDYYKNDDNTP